MLARSLLKGEAYLKSHVVAEVKGQHKSLSYMTGAKKVVFPPQ